MQSLLDPAILFFVFGVLAGALFQLLIWWLGEHQPQSPRDIEVLFQGVSAPVLARLKGLRGTALDPFGRTEDRKMERALIDQYLASMEEVLKGLDAGNHAAAVELARIPELIKGYGHVKARNVEQAQQQWVLAMAAFRHPALDVREAA